jgi:hypothetical protein
MNVYIETAYALIDFDIYNIKHVKYDIVS